MVSVPSALGTGTLRLSRSTPRAAIWARKHIAVSQIIGRRPNDAATHAPITGPMIQPAVLAILMMATTLSFFSAGLATCSS